MRSTLATLLLADAVEKGGEGSGNFGHEGRPGLVGGSGDGGGGAGDGAASSAEGRASTLRQANEISALANRTEAAAKDPKGYRQAAEYFRSASDKFKTAAREARAHAEELRKDPENLRVLVSPGGRRGIPSPVTRAETSARSYETAAKELHDRAVAAEESAKEAT